MRKVTRNPLFSFEYNIAICPALKKAGILDARSPEAIKFCTGGRFTEDGTRCPYPECIAVTAHDRKQRCDRG